MIRVRNVPIYCYGKMDQAVNFALNDLESMGHKVTDIKMLPAVKKFKKKSVRDMYDFDNDILCNVTIFYEVNLAQKKSY